MIRRDDDDREAAQIAHRIETGLTINRLQEQAFMLKEMGFAGAAAVLSHRARRLEEAMGADDRFATDEPEVTPIARCGIYRGGI